AAFMILLRRRRECSTTQEPVFLALLPRRPVVMIGNRGGRTADDDRDLVEGIDRHLVAAAGKFGPVQRSVYRHGRAAKSGKTIGIVAQPPLAQELTEGEHNRRRAFNVDDAGGV